MKLTETRAYVREQILFHKARVLLKRRGVSIAAYAMFRLNRMAQMLSRGNPLKENIYALKNLLILNFYERGYCVNARQSKQTLKCNWCGGTGDDGWHDYETCGKCDGTGIYRVYDLWDFTFRIGERTYRWHQPKSLVKWDVTATNDEITKYESPAFDKTIVPVHGERLRLLLAILYQYLVAQSALESQAVATLSLRTSLYLDLIALPFHEWHLHLQHLQQLQYRIDRAVFDFRLMLANTARRFQSYDAYLAERDQEIDELHRISRMARSNSPTHEAERIDTAADNETESPF